MATVKKLRYAITEQEHAASWETGVDVDYDEAPQAEYEGGVDAEYEEGADPDYDEAAQVDYNEQLTDPSYEEGAQEAPAEVALAPVLFMRASTTDFAFEVGHPVKPATQQQAYPVVWRGLLKERHPATGLLLRVPVYRLADGYWDCYREEELQAA